MVPSFGAFDLSLLQATAALAVAARLLRLQALRKSAGGVDSGRGELEISPVRAKHVLSFRPRVRCTGSGLGTVLYQYRLVKVCYGGILCYCLFFFVLQKKRGRRGIFFYLKMPAK